jgi:hypothetical protein
MYWLLVDVGRHHPELHAGGKQPTITTGENQIVILNLLCRGAMHRVVAAQRSQLRKPGCSTEDSIVDLHDGELSPQPIQQPQRGIMLVGVKPTHSVGLRQGRRGFDVHDPGGNHRISGVPEVPTERGARFRDKQWHER